jgi:hypothetical protein
MTVGTSRNKTALIQVACGFELPPENVTDFKAVSCVDQHRAVKVLETYDSLNLQLGKNCLLWTTGMVPYDAKTHPYTLADINMAYLQKHLGLEAGGRFGLATDTVPGLNAFSESWNACMKAKEAGCSEIVVVSSDFYFIAYRRMWRAAAYRLGLACQTLTVDSLGISSEKVWDFYTSPLAQSMSRIATKSRARHSLIKSLADIRTRDRVNGFKFNGYTQIG